ncbi:MAG: DMT family transporter [Anaerolineae bacterium]
MVLGVVAGLLCALCWAVGSVSIRNLARKLDPFTLNAPRTLAGGILTIMLLLISGRTSQVFAITPEKLFYLVASITVSSVIGDALYVTSIARMGVSRTIPIANAYPALTLILGLVFLKEQLAWPLIVGLVLVMVGVFLVSRKTSAIELEAAQLTSGLPYAVSSAVFWAAGMIMVAPGLVGVDALAASAIRTPALSLILWIIVIIRRSYHQLAQLSRREWIILVLGGAIGWGLGNLFFVQAVSLLGATRAAILASTPPLFALPLSVFWLKEKPTWAIVGGTVLAVIGITFIS